MQTVRLFNECKISHLLITASGVIRASYRKTHRLLSKGYPTTKGCYERERQRLLESLEGHFGRRSTVKAGSIDWAARHPLIGPEQALTWLVESIKAGEWKALQLAAVEQYIWDLWRKCCTDYRQQVRCFHLLRELRTLVEKTEGVKDTSPAKFKRQQGGSQDV